MTRRACCVYVCVLRASAMLIEFGLVRRAGASTFESRFLVPEFGVPTSLSSSHNLPGYALLANAAVFSDFKLTLPRPRSFGANIVDAAIRLLALRLPGEWVVPLQEG